MSPPSCCVESSALDWVERDGTGTIPLHIAPCNGVCAGRDGLGAARCPRAWRGKEGLLRWIWTYGGGRCVSVVCGRR
jgi:hypothetical protein